MRTQGRVTDVFVRPWEGRNGPINLHSFKIEGDNKFFRSGEAKLVEVNQLVEFEYDSKGNVNPDSVAVTGVATTPPPAQQQEQKQAWAGKGGSGGGFKAKQAAKDQYWEDKEKRQIEIVEPRITWSSAQSDAVAVVNAALQHDLLAFGNANKSAKLGLLLDYVDQVTARFAAQRFNAAELLKDAISESEGKDHEDERTASRNDNDLG